LSGFLFGGPLGPYFELFLANYCIILSYEETTLNILLSFN